MLYFPRPANLIEERLRRALQGGRIAAWEWDLATGALSWSDNVAEILGFFPATQEAFEAMVHPPDRELYRTALHRTLDDGAPYDTEFRFLKPDGTVIWIQNKAQPQIDESGRSILSGITIEITARKKAEASAQEATALHEETAATLRATLENMDQGLIMFDAAGTIQVYNQRVAELLGLPLDQLARRPSFRELIDYQLAQGEFVRGDEVLRQWATESGIGGVRDVYERERPDGTVLEVRTVPLPNGGAVRTYTDMTARRRAEADLRGSEERYRAVVNANVTALWRTAPDGGITEAVGWSQYTGQSEREYHGQGWLDVVHPEDRDRAIAIWQASLRSGDPVEVRYRIRRADGAFRWSVARAAAVKRQDGAIREWVGTIVDIHEHRIAQEALSRSEERLRLATEATGLGTYDADLATGWRQWSPEMRTILGLDPDAPISRKLMVSLIHPDDRERVVAAYEQSIKEAGERLQVDFRIVRADDRAVRWVSGLGRTLQDAAGRPTRVVGTLRDITAEKTAELALRESEARYRLLADNATDMIVRTDVEGICRYMSPASSELLGYEPEELLGTRLAAITHPEDLEPVVSGLEDLISQRAHHLTTTFRARHKDGHWVWLESYRRTVIDEDAGGCIAVLSIVRDISERRKLEDRLRQAQRLQAVGQLTGGIAHDFNNLLTVVLGNAEVLADCLSDPELRTMAQMVQDAAEKGASLTQHLLAFARRQTLKPERLSLDVVVSGVEPLLRRTITESIHLLIQPSEDPPLALVDRALLESAVLNLALNARDAMPAGGVLAVRTGRRMTEAGEGNLAPGQPVVFLTVSDTGSGMTPEVLERAFEPFFTTKDVGQGSGLGLSMVYGFAEQSGGHVAIDSHAGVGTSVTILLPAIAPEEIEVAQNGAENRASVPSTSPQNHADHWPRGVGAGTP
jgi:PAS domain S-box-containing protein